MSPSLRRSLVAFALCVAPTAFASPIVHPVPNINPSEFNLAPLYTPPPPPDSTFAPLSWDQQPVEREPFLIEDSYIVVLKNHVSHAQAEDHRNLVAQVHETDVRLRRAKMMEAVASGFDDPTLGVADLGGHRHAYTIKDFRGYAGKYSEAVVDAIRSMPEVEFVERDSRVWATDIEKGAPWGLARISHRKPLSFGTFNKYAFDGNGGEGVDAYVIDTGVNIKHVELEGRARWGKTIPNDADVDAHGHGSHVAGTMASKTYGVAKKANIIAVKVLGAGGSGTMSDVIGGVAWAATSAQEAAAVAARSTNSTHKGSVANMSLGGGKSPALDTAVNNAVKAGLSFAVAAGNDNRDACSSSPASAENAVTVGASTISDSRAYFSNHGKCVDVFGPGLNILSIWNTGNNSVNTISGTSMASPHVAGALAYFLSLYPDNFQPTDEDYAVAGVPKPSADSFEEKVAALFSGDVWRKGSQFVFGGLRQWSGKTLAPVPKPKAPLDPAVLKAALLRIATKDVLTDLPGQTVNLLLFNNATLV